MWSKIILIVSTVLIQKLECTVNKSESETRALPPPPPFAPPLLYPVNAATGILVAVAVPVPLPEHNIFVSYNFEANYNMPNAPADSFPGKIDRWTLQNPNPFPQLYGPPPPIVQGATVDDVVARRIDENPDEESEPETTEISHEVSKRSYNDRQIFTRRGAYQTIVNRLNTHGIDGKKCLLLAICDIARFPFIENNGVLGHVLHVILTPSSSVDENLPTEFTKAETLGRKGNCKKYEKHCQMNVLDLFSKMI